MFRLVRKTWALFWLTRNTLDLDLGEEYAVMAFLGACLLHGWRLR